MNCRICLNDIKTKDLSYSLPECGHKFHTKCIVHWFRSNQTRCPLCNHGGAGNINYIPSTRKLRLKYLKRIARRKCTNKEIKILTKKLKKSERRIKILRRNKKDFLNSKEKLIAKQFNQKYNKIENKIYHAYQIKKKIISELCNLPLVPIIIVERKKVIVNQ